MDQLEEADVGCIQPDTHSFIVKVWLNDHRQEGGRVDWHGRIIHVPSGHRHHFAKLKDVAVFVAPYLHQLGVRPTLGWKVRQWLRGRP
jgi:hypothetical protein